MRFTACTFVVALVMILPLRAQDAPSPEECIARAGASAVTVAYEGKTYRMASEACRGQFLSDPERYAQLYDALAELEKQGVSAVPPTASLVPS